MEHSWIILPRWVPQAGTGEEFSPSKQERVAETMYDDLTKAPIPQPAVPLWERR